MLKLDPIPKRSRLLAIAGGSCSGKTTLAVKLYDLLGADICRLVKQDDYYHDISERGGSPLANFDIPEALDFTLLRDNLLAFKRGEAVALPSYDFKTHRRQMPTEPLAPRPLIIIEGILLLDVPPLREVFDHSVYIRCPQDLRLSRRLARDTIERGRARPDVLRQFHEQVEPAHQTHVSPSQSFADLIIDQADYVQDTAQTIESVIKMLNKGPKAQ